jgi:hypothetical protein
MALTLITAFNTHRLEEIEAEQTLNCNDRDQGGEEVCLPGGERLSVSDWFDQMDLVASVVLVAEDGFRSTNAFREF